MRSALTKLKGVKSADVVIGRATVKIEKGKVTAEQLIEAVKKAGYSAKVKS